MDSRSRKRSLSSDTEVETPPERQKTDVGVFDFYVVVCLSIKLITITMQILHGEPIACE